MKKLTKLNLNDLKVESFITSLKGNDSQTLKGGSTAPCVEVAALAELALTLAVASAGAAVAVSIYKKVRNSITDEEYQQIHNGSIGCSNVGAACK